MKILVSKILTRVPSFFLTLPTSAVLLPIHAIGLLLWWAAGSYLGVDVFSSRSFLGEDGWCEPQSQGLGVHCWGDYYYPIHLLGKGNPFDNSQPNPYPAASLLVFLLFDVLGDFFGGGRAGLLLYLLTMVGSIAGAAWLSTKGQELNNRLVLTSCVTWLAPPVLIALDRGNSAGFLVAGLVWFFYSLNSNKTVQQLCSIVFLSLVKPHFAILAFVYAVRGKPVSTIKTLAAAALVHGLAFALLRPQAFPLNLIQWIQGLVGYQDYSSVAVPWPPNLSFAQSIYAFAYGLDALGVPISNESLSSIAAAQGVFGPAVLVAVIFGLIFLRRIFSVSQSAFVLLVVITLGSATTFAYYAIIAVPILLDLEARKLALGKTNLSPNKEARTHQKIDFCIWVGSVFSLVQLPIFGAQVGDKILTGYSLVGGVWLSCFAIIFLVAAKQQLTDRRLPV
jgi:hypothetical protein